MTERRRLELAWSDRQGQACLEVRGWTEAELHELRGLTSGQLGRRLVVLPGELVDADTNLGALQSPAGRFEIDQDAVSFIPQFPFMDGLTYALLVDSGADRTRANPDVWRIQRRSRMSAPTTEVVAIYPSANELPINQLRLYVHFRNSMSEGWAARAVHVRRTDDGAPLEHVFLAMEPELWDSQRRRLTLLLEPGRIKRGLGPNLESGYPLTEGVPIVVTVDATCRDAAGRPLRASAERRYDVGPSVRARVDPSQWRYDFPTTGSTDPLTVTFDRPLDHALLEHSLWVYGSSGLPLVGQGFVGSGERCWRFEPGAPWTEGRYSIVVDPRLEDLAGNSLHRVFDRDLTRPEDTPTDARHVAIDFTCSAPFTPSPRKLVN